MCVDDSFGWSQKKKSSDGENKKRAFVGTAGWTAVGRALNFPDVSPSSSAARAWTERGLLSQHAVGAAHP